MAIQNAINQSKNYFIYDRLSGQKVPVTEETFNQLTKESDRIRKKEQYHHRCMCPKQFVWKCDGCCLDCEYHAAGDTLSTDVPNEDGEGNMYDYLPDTAPSMEDVISDRLLLRQLIQRLRELDPDADRIIQMLGEEMSDRAIAERLGRKQRTFADQMKRYRTELRKIRGY